MTLAWRLADDVEHWLNDKFHSLYVNVQPIAGAQLIIRAARLDDRGQASAYVFETTVFADYVYDNDELLTQLHLIA